MLPQIMDQHQTGDTVTVTYCRGQHKLTARSTLESLGRDGVTNPKTAQTRISERERFQ